MLHKQISRIMLAAQVCYLAACSPHVAYYALDPANHDPDPAGSLRFTLEDATITVPAPPPAVGAAAAAAAAAKKTAPPAIDSCAGTGADGDHFNLCFTSVPAPTVVASALNEQGAYLAEPDDFLPALLFRTGISGSPVSSSGSPVSGQTYLFQKITITSTDNIGKTATSVATGVTTGFALGGPAGAAVGGIIGIVGPAVAGAPVRPPVGKIGYFVCPSVREKLDLSQMPELTTPALGLPVIIKASDAMPFGLENDSTKTPIIDNESLHKKSDATADYPGCWRPLPNALSLNNPIPPQFTDVNNPPNVNRAKVKPTQGDGWFYRIVVDPTRDPLTNGAKDTSKTLPAPAAKTKGSIPANQFPFSFCRSNAYLEILWWTELDRAGQAADQAANAAASPPPPIKTSLIRLKLPDFPDPNFVSVVNLPPGGGTISFNATCGATAQSGTPPDFSADWSTALTQAGNVQKALSSSATAKATSSTTAKTK